MQFSNSRQHGLARNAQMRVCNFEVLQVKSPGFPLTSYQRSAAGPILACCKSDTLISVMMWLLQAAVLAVILPAYVDSSATVQQYAAGNDGDGETEHAQSDFIDGHTCT